MDASGAVNPHALYASMARRSRAGVTLADAGSVVAELLGDWSSTPEEAVGEPLGRRQPNSGLIARHLRAAAARWRGSRP